jgi:hypothetical protein
MPLGPAALAIRTLAAPCLDAFLWRDTMIHRLTLATLLISAAPALASGPGIFEPADATVSLPSRGGSDFTPGTSAGLGGSLGAGGETSNAGLASGGDDDDRWLQLNTTPTRIDSSSSTITFVPTPGSIALIGAGIFLAARRRRA